MLQSQWFCKTFYRGAQLKKFWNSVGYWCTFSRRYVAVSSFLWDLLKFCHQKYDITLRYSVMYGMGFWEKCIVRHSVVEYSLACDSTFVRLWKSNFTFWTIPYWFPFKQICFSFLVLSGANSKSAAIWKIRSKKKRKQTVVQIPIKNYMWINSVLLMGDFQNSGSPFYDSVCTLVEQQWKIWQQKLQVDKFVKGMKILVGNVLLNDTKTKNRLPTFFLFFFLFYFIFCKFKHTTILFRMDTRRM